MSTRKLAALGGFIVLGLSPSFVDWEQTDGNTQRRLQIIGFYLVGLALVYWGLLA